MTHEDIINSIKSARNTFYLGDYISIAAANKWSNIRICEEISYRGLASWPEVSKAIREFDRVYEDGTEQKLKKIIYKGKEYKSINHLCLELGKSRRQIEYAIEKGRAMYV